MAYQYETLKLDKSMYRNAGVSFSQMLEKADPSRQYKGTELEGLDAFQRQLKRFDIKVKGPDSDCVEKFFHTAESAVLFPEYIARCVHQGIEEADILPYITGAVTHIDGLDYRTLTTEQGDHSKVYAVGEGAEIPSTTVRVCSDLVKLHKRGRMLVASYETIRYQKLDLFSITLRQIGAGIAKSLAQDACGALFVGNDGESPLTIYETRQANIVTYEDLVDLWLKLAPYEMNTLMVSDDVFAQLMKLPELQNPLGANFQTTGKLVTPMGATLLRLPVNEPGTIIALDKRYALEMVQSGEVSVEYDKLIDRQLERAAITVTCGYARMFEKACAMMLVKSD